MSEQNNAVETEKQEMEVVVEKPKKGKKIGIIVFIILILLAGLAGGGWYFYQKDQQEKIVAMMSQEGIYNGITIGGINVSGMSAEAATLLLENDTQINGELWTIQLGFEEEEWSYTLEELGVSFLLAEAAADAYAYGRGTDANENISQVQGLLSHGLDFPITYTFEREMMEDILVDLQDEIDQELVEATMVRDREKEEFIVTEDQVGRSLNVSGTEAAVVSLIEAMMEGSVSGVNSGRLELDVEVEEPNHTEEIFLESQDLIGTYYTTYTFTDINRNTNLEVGCAYITDTILMPGDEFSANEGLGEQTAERGYKDAGVYENGKVVSGMGGGVCQITTTLYNAAIFAEIEIVKRYAHSMPVGYVPLGRDAAVAGTYKDLVIKNDTEYPIYLEAYAENGILQVNLYGHEIHEPDRTLEYKTVWEQTVAKPDEIITEDPEMYEGEREVTYTGQTGSIIAVYKLVYEDDELISEELFNKSSYIAVADEVTVGTKPVETTPVYVPSYEDLWGNISASVEDVVEEVADEDVEFVLE